MSDADIVLDVMDASCEYHGTDWYAGCETCDYQLSGIAALSRVEAELVNATKLALAHQTCESRILAAEARVTELEASMRQILDGEDPIRVAREMDDVRAALVEGGSMSDRETLFASLDAMEDYLSRNSPLARSRAHFVNSMLSLIAVARGEAEALVEKNSTYAQRIEGLQLLLDIEVDAES